MTNTDLITLYAAHRPIEKSTREQYQIALDLFATFAQTPNVVREFTEERLREFLAWYRHRVASPRTVNGKRSSLLTLWRFAAELDLCDPPNSSRIKRLPEYRRIPTAWSIEEVGRLVAATEWSRPLPGWDCRHWRALIFTLYDTSLRISPVLRVPRDAVDADGWLLCPAEIQKGKADTMHRLHPQTIEAIEALPESDLLFAWPFRKRAIWPEFKTILQSAGLPSTRRDLFHKLRRTSYTFVYAELGPQAATEHAAHRGDMSAHYLDPTKLNRRDAIDCLPRPA